MTMFGVVYQWRVDPSQADQFLAIWTELTALIRDEYGGRGSRMHRAGDTWFAYAEWPSEDQFRKRKQPSERASLLRAQMRAVSIEIAPDLSGEVVTDLLVR